MVVKEPQEQRRFELKLNQADMNEEMKKKVRAGQRRADATGSPPPWILLTTVAVLDSPR